MFLVRHPRLPRNDALKLLNPALSLNSEFCQRFEREADLLAPLRHPNIVTLYDRGNYEGRLWLSMEHIPGSDASELTKAGALDVTAVIDIITCIGDALDYAYSEHAVTHRDVKPANILVETGQDHRPKTVKLVDFGIAKAAGETTSLTAAGTAIGTVSYIAPEALEGAVTDNRADIYSLACTAFQMLTRALPYPQKSVPALIAAHLNEPPPTITEFRTHLPEHFDDVFIRALAKNPAERFTTCREFTDALRRPNSPRPGTRTQAWIKSVAAAGDTVAASPNSAPTQAAPINNAGGARKPSGSKAVPTAASSDRVMRARRVATLGVIAVGVLGIVLLGSIGLIAIHQKESAGAIPAQESSSSAVTSPATTTSWRQVADGRFGGPAFVVASATDYTEGTLTTCGAHGQWQRQPAAPAWWCRDAPASCPDSGAVEWWAAQWGTAVDAPVWRRFCVEAAEASRSEQACRQSSLVGQCIWELAAWPPDSATVEWKLASVERRCATPVEGAVLPPSCLSGKGFSR